MKTKSKDSKIKVLLLITGSIAAVRIPLLVSQLAKENYFSKDSQVVVVFPDHGSRYMSKIYSEKWMAEQGFFDSDNESHQNIEYINDQVSKK